MGMKAATVSLSIFLFFFFLSPSFLKRKKDQGPVYFYLMCTYQTSITEKLDIMQNLTIEYLPWDRYFLSINSRRNKILFLNLI